jgi:hypothetical protein
MRQLVLCACLASLGSQVVAADLRVSLEERLVGDSNVLRLSDQDRDRLDQDESFETDVDGDAALKLEQRLNTRLTWRYRPKTGFLAFVQKPFGTKQSRIDLSAANKWSHFEGSPSKGYGSHRISLAWTPKPGWGLDVSTRLLDNFYLRRFTDRNTGQRHGCDFDALENSVSLRFRGDDVAGLERPSLKMAWVRERSSYNAWFTEYDTDAWALDMQFSARLPQGFDGSLSYRYSSTNNIGYDAATFDGGFNLDEGGDASHEEDGLKLNLGWRGDVSSYHLNVDLDLGFRDRWYGSNLGEIMDPVHYGRHDRRYFLGLRGQLTVRKGLTLIPLLEREWRVVEAAWTDIYEVKDFEVWRVGVGLKWQIL